MRACGERFEELFFQCDDGRAANGGVVLGGDGLAVNLQTCELIQRAACADGQCAVALLRLASVFAQGSE